MIPSTIDAPNMWARSIAGTAASSPYGLYSGRPFSEKNKKLKTQDDPDSKRSHRDPDLAANSARPSAARRQQGGPAGDQAICPIAGERQDDRHRQAIEEDGQDAAVSEEERLDDQGDADGYDRGPRPQDDRHERAADPVCRGSSRHGHVEHHDREAQRREDCEERDGPVVEDLLDLLSRHRPNGDRDQPGANRHDRTDVPVGNVQSGPPLMQRCVTTSLRINTMVDQHRITRIARQI